MQSLTHRKLLRRTFSRAFGAVSVVATLACCNAAEVEAPPEHPDMEGAQPERSVLEQRVDRVEAIFAPSSEHLVRALDITLSAENPFLQTIELADLTCVVVSAAAEDISAELELRLMTGDGEPISEARSGGGIVSDQLRCVEPEGGLQIALYAPRADAEISAALTVSRVRDALTVGATEAIRGLEDPYARGAVNAGPLNELSLNQDERYRASVAMLHGRCYSILGVSEASVDIDPLWERGLEVRHPNRAGGVAAPLSDPPLDVDFRLMDEQEVVLKADLGTDEQPVIERFCPEESAVYRLDISMYRGSGLFFWRVYELEPAAE